MADDPLPDASPAEFPHWRRNTRALMVGSFLNPFGFTVAFPYLPLIMKDLGVEGDLEMIVGVVVGVFFLLSFGLAPVWGSMADHFGRKAMILRAGLGMSLGFTLMGLAPGLGSFIFFYVLVGTCNGYVPAALALVATNTPRGSMGRALSGVQTGALLGTTCGPALGAWLAVSLPSSQWLYLISGGACALAGLVALIWVREDFQRPPGPFRLHLVTDMLAIGRLPGMGPLLRLHFIVSMLLFGSTTAVSLFVLEMGQVPELLRGYSVEIWVGVATLALTIASAVALPFWGRILDRFDPARVMGLALIAGVVVALPFPFVRDPLELTIARVALGLFAVGLQPAGIRMVKEWAPAGMDGRALSMATALNMLGNGGGPFLAGIIGSWWNLRAYFAVMAVLVLLGMMEWLWRGMHIQRAPAP